MYVTKGHTALLLGTIKSASNTTPMNLRCNLVEWHESIKYRVRYGVYLQRSTSVKFDINPTKRAFYAACNTIFLYGSEVDESTVELARNFVCNYVCYTCTIYALLLDKLMPD